MKREYTLPENTMQGVRTYQSEEMKPGRCLQENRYIKSHAVYCNIFVTASGNCNTFAYK